jgi:hypothetical protein
MARAKARKTAVQIAPADMEALPPGATDFEPEEFESAAHAQEAYRASEQAEREFAAGHHHVENGERPKPQAEEHAPKGHAAAVDRKKWTPPKDPFGFENVKAGENRVQLLKSENKGAWVIRFEHNPNLDKGPDGETYTKENPHPVLKMLKAEGYRWGFDQDDKGGWGKAFSGDAYVQDHMKARDVLAKAAELIGQKREEAIPL